MTSEICFAGGGRMASAMIRGLLKSGISPDSVMVADPVEAVRDEWRRLLPDGHVHRNAAELKGNPSAVLVLAVKPQHMEDVLREVGTSPWSTVISIAAGVRLSRLESSFSVGTPVIRAMPNTPALIGRGITVISGGKNATENSMTDAEKILGAVGEVVRAEEDLLDAVTAISGSGPAYYLLVMKELIAAAQELGIESELAKKLVLATAAGSAELARAQNIPMESMIAAVASKGGTTERALAVFQDRDLGGTIRAATRAAYERSKELGR